MNRDELLELRNILRNEVERLRLLGDFDANAGGVRFALETCLKLTQHLLDRLRKA